MKAKKRLRQEQQRGQKDKEARQQFLENMKVVLLKKDSLSHSTYIWKCPNHDGTFSWSRQINAQWGHPDDLAFCAVCMTYHRIEFEQEQMRV